MYPSGLRCVHAYREKELNSAQRSDASVEKERETMTDMRGWSRRMEACMMGVKIRQRVD